MLQLTWTTIVCPSSMLATQHEGYSIVRLSDTAFLAQGNKPGQD
jgi:hypothetical protein